MNLKYNVEKKLKKKQLYCRVVYISVNRLMKKTWRNGGRGGKMEAGGSERDSIRSSDRRRTGCLDVSLTNHRLLTALMARGRLYNKGPAADSPPCQHAM